MLLKFDVHSPELQDCLSIPLGLFTAHTWQRRPYLVSVAMKNMLTALSILLPFLRSAALLLLLRVLCSIVQTLTELRSAALGSLARKPAAKMLWLGLS